MKIITRNVNGIRAIAKKGLKEFILKELPDILCLQEVKAFEGQFIEEIGYIKGYDFLWHAGEKAGYAGTAILFKNDLNILEKKNYFKDKEIFNTDGRVTQVEFETPILNSFPLVKGKEEATDSSPSTRMSSSYVILGQPERLNRESTRGSGEKGLGDRGIVLLNVYFPNGGTRADGREMLSYKLNFYNEIIEYCNEIVKTGKNVIITGDFNICHTEIDIARPKENEDSIGFLPIERQKFGEFLNNGYIDTFRYFFPDKTEVYSWWSYRTGARPRNVGWRLDYFLINKKFIKNIEETKYLTNIMGSDHCPVELRLK